MHFLQLVLPSGGLLKSQMLLPGWVVSESSSGLEMQWGGDTYWRIFKRAFGLLEWSLVILLKCEGAPPPLLPWIPARWDGQPWSWGLDAGCSRRAAAGGVVRQAMLADRWIGGQKSGLEKEDTKEERKGERREKKTEGERGKTFFWRGRRRISQVWLSFTLSYLIFEDHLTFLADIQMIALIT